MYNRWNVREKRRISVKNNLRRLGALLCALVLCLTSARALSVEDALTLLEKNYVDALPSAAYKAETLDELFDAVGDPYTYYLSKDEYQAFTDSVESESSFVGIGVTVEYTANGILITSVLNGGSAKDAGLRAGDLIVAIDGVSCAPASDAHSELIRRGEAGTYVDLTVRRADGSVQTHRLERRLIELRNTTVTYENDVGTFDCDSFGSHTADYFFLGLASYPQAKQWVVDLRGNGGGYADAALYILGAFTGSGRKLIYHMGDGSSMAQWIAAERVTDKPVIVLVDQYTASASEFFANGIRAAGDGIVIGERTYGKGSAQLVFDETNTPSLFDGDALKITSYRFYSGDGCTSDRIGVLPTLLVEDEYASEAAALLSATKPERGDYLALTLNGVPFYLPLAEAVLSEHRAALSKLLSALPPDVSVFRQSENALEKLTAAQALERWGNVSDSRRFADVSDSPYEAQIDTLGVYHILGGVGDGRFDPNAALTRAQLAALLAQALDLSDGSSDVFSDVPDDRWYTGKIGAVASLGFMDGVGDGRFDPDAGLTQEQFIAVMGRLARFLNCNVDDYARNRAETVPSESAYAAFSEWARCGADVLTGYDRLNMLYAPLSDIEPGAPVTRAQAAATLCNTLKALRLLSY